MSDRPADAPVSAGRAYAELRRLVIDGELQPGDKMVVRVLAARLGLSATPVKSALAALSRDGLATAEPNRGYFVTVLDHRDVRELFELREALEPYAARLAATAGVDADAVRELRSMTQAQRDAAAADEFATYNELNQAFHRTLWQLSGNRRLCSGLDDVMGQMSLATTFTSRAPGRLDRAIEEHAELVNLHESGDADRLAERTARHVRESYAAYLAMVGT